MVRRDVAASTIIGLLVVAVTLGFLHRNASAEEPPHVTFSPQPPGTVVQSQLVYLAGESMHGQWRGVLSKKLLGTGHGTASYQWYLSIYLIHDTTYRLRYRSPDAPAPFSRVTKARGVPMWFPFQDATIAGTGEFMGPGAQQLVVQSRQVGADCGEARVDVFFFDAAMQMVMTTLSVENPCDLEASIVHEQGGDALRLTGPYYAANAPLCCPTNPRAQAILHFHNGTWTEQPALFKILVRAGIASLGRQRISLRIPQHLLPCRL